MQYSGTTREHFLDPRNAGPMEDADAIGTIGDPSCGDSLTMFIKVREGVIRDISYLVFGCGAAIASASMTSVMAKGRRLEEALLLTDEDIAAALGGLPESKMHCSNLGVGALRKAIEKYGAAGPEAGSGVIVIGTDPPCSRCGLLFNAAKEILRERGIDTEPRHLSYTSEEARDLALRAGLIPGTAKDVAAAAGIDIDGESLASVLAEELPGPDDDYFRYNACGWTPALDEFLRPLEYLAPQVGILMTPVLVINGRIRHQGCVPPLAELERMLGELKRL